MLNEEMICRIFDRFCMVCIRNEWISWLREQKRIAEREINMESAATKYPEFFTSMDTYPSESTIFDVQGLKIAITNDNLAEGLNKLSEYSRNVILMAFVLGESNEEIARCMGRCRSTISVQKKSGLKKLRKYMEK